MPYWDYLFQIFVSRLDGQTKRDRIPSMPVRQVAEEFKQNLCSTFIPEKMNFPGKFSTNVGNIPEKTLVSSPVFHEIFVKKFYDSVDLFSFIVVTLPGEISPANYIIS